MIITDIKQLQDVPVGEIVTLVLQFHVTRANGEDENPCKGCVFDDCFCCTCCSVDRTDNESVQFLKI